MSTHFSWLHPLVLLSFLSCAYLPVCLADAEPPTPASGPQILEEFGRQQPQTAARSTTIAEHERQVIIFTIVAALLLLFLADASVGIAVGVFGKPLFLLHMILASLTVTLALVHVIVGLVWFFPF